MPELIQDRIIPQIIVDDGIAAMEFIKRAFNAEEVSRVMHKDGKKLMHGEVKIGGHLLFVSDEFDASEGGTCRSPKTLGGTGVRITLEVANADETAAAAVAAGATVMMPVQDMFWGGRYGKIIDPFGHEWGINQQKKAMSDADANDAAQKYFAERK